MNRYKPYFKEEKDFYKARNPILRTFIEKHNEIDDYMTRNATKFEYDENRQKYAVKINKELMVMVLQKYSILTKAYNLNGRQSPNEDIDLPLNDYIHRQLKNFDEYIKSPHIGKFLYAYSFLHDIIKIYIPFDRRMNT